MAVTASDDRGSGEIAPGAPEEAHISGRRGGSFKYTQHKSTDHWSLIVMLFHENEVVQLPQAQTSFLCLPVEDGGVGHF